MTSTHARKAVSLQLNEYETDRYFLQNFQCTTLLIHEFRKVCNHEIVLQECKSKTKTISGSQVLQNKRIIKQTVVLLWKN